MTTTQPSSGCPNQIRDKKIGIVDKADARAERGSRLGATHLLLQSGDRHGRLRELGHLRCPLLQRFPHRRRGTVGRRGALGRPLALRGQDRVELGLRRVRQSAEPPALSECGREDQKWFKINEKKSRKIYVKKERKSRKNESKGGTALAPGGFGELGGETLRAGLGGGEVGVGAPHRALGLQQLHGCLGRHRPELCFLSFAGLKLQRPVVRRICDVNEGGTVKREQE